MARDTGQDECDEGRDGASARRYGRWQRRARRREAERRRMPKHGKSYADLAQRMIARRAADATRGPAGPDEQGARRRNP